MLLEGRATFRGVHGDCIEAVRPSVGILRICILHFRQFGCSEDVELTPAVGSTYPDVGAAVQRLVLTTISGAYCPDAATGTNPAAPDTTVGAPDMDVPETDAVAVEQDAAPFPMEPDADPSR